jgi:uncharacterized protein YcfL
MKTPKTLAASFLAFGALVAGCASGRGGPQTTMQGGESTPGMVELDSGVTLGHELKMLNLNQTRRSGFLVAQFDLHNQRGSSLALEWSVDWFDQHGMKIVTNENWRPLVIGGRGYETLQITAPTPEAEEWRLKFQKPNPVR